LKDLSIGIAVIARTVALEVVAFLSSTMRIVKEYE
jgi:hypothetical protein